MNSRDNQMIEPTESSKKLRNRFNYVLNNIQRIRASKKLKIFELDLDSNTSQINTNHSSDFGLDPNQSIIDDNDINEIDFKIRGEEDIKKDFNEQQLKDIIESLKTIECFKDLSLQQINYLVKSFEQILREISCDQKMSSFFGEIYQNLGYPGIAANIQFSLFSKTQNSYILGCLYGLFPDDHQIGPKVFGVLFPETLVRIAMNIKRIDYKTALDLLKPISLSYD